MVSTPLIKTVFIYSSTLLRCLMEPQNHDPTFHFEYRGPIVMKGKKEPMQCWYLTEATDGEIQSEQ